MKFPDTESFTDYVHLAAFIRNAGDMEDTLDEASVRAAWDALDEEKQGWVLAQYITHRLERK